MIDDIKADAAMRMAKSVESLAENLTKVRTGRAHPNMLDHLSTFQYRSGGCQNTDCSTLGRGFS